MNKIIAELYDQAIVIEDGRDYVCGELDPVKFAELIVRECLKIVNRKEYSYHEADPLWETAQLIKEHFGVSNAT
jgi:hypothetical protein